MQSESTPPLHRPAVLASSPRSQARRRAHEDEVGSRWFLRRRPREGGRRRALLTRVWDGWLDVLSAAAGERAERVAHRAAEHMWRSRVAGRVWHGWRA